MYQPLAAHDLSSEDATTEMERQHIRLLARQLDGIEIRETLIPSDSFEASRLIRNLEKRVERKRISGVRSSLTHCYEH